MQLCKNMSCAAEQLAAGNKTVEGCDGWSKSLVSFARVKMEQTMCYSNARRGSVEWPVNRTDECDNRLAQTTRQMGVRFIKLRRATGKENG